MSASIECPRCGQGSVKRYRVRATVELWQVCDDAVWPADVDPGSAPYATLVAVMAARGLPPLWSELDPR